MVVVGVGGLLKFSLLKGGILYVFCQIEGGVVNRSVNKNFQSSAPSRI